MIGWRILALVVSVLYLVLVVAPVVLVWILGVLPYWLVTGRTGADLLDRLACARFMDRLLSKAGME